MSYQLVIFDWDGTLMDSIGRIVSSMHGAAARMGLTRVPEQAVHDIIGLSLGEAVARLYPRLDATRAHQLQEHYRVQYQHENDTPSAPFAHAGEMLRRLREHGLLLAVATGKARRGLDRVLQETGLGPLFDVTRGADEARSKPDPLMLEQILAQTGVATTQAVMVGDSIHDMEMARRIGMDRIAVTFGVHERQRLAPYSPVASIDCLSELPALLGAKKICATRAPQLA